MASPRSSAAGGSANPTVQDIIEFLNHKQVRATYGAVAELLGVIPRSMGARLGPHRAELSWIVNAASGLPTDYAASEMHAALRSRNEIITTAADLQRRIAIWKRG
jgi:alkylated DNA nucleotide flippase Atl1